MANTKPSANITLFRTNIKKELNLLIDDLDTYLNGLANQVSYEIQYIKHGLTIRVKLNITEDEQTYLNYNYCSIQNRHFEEGEETPVLEEKCYYFIDSVKPVSQNALELNLSLDTVNTLGKDNYAANPRNFLSTTKIERQHKDRFVKPASLNPFAQTITLTRKIDKVSEGLIPNLVKNSDEILHDATLTDFAANDENLDADQSWYLVYRQLTAGDTVNFRIELYGDEATLIKISDEEITRNGTSYGTGKVAYYTKPFNLLDVVDNKITKIIKLPYCPCQVSRVANTTSSAYVYARPSHAGDYIYTFKGYVEKAGKQTSAQWINLSTTARDTSWGINGYISISTIAGTPSADAYIVPYFTFTLAGSTINANRWSFRRPGVTWFSSDAVRQTITGGIGPTDAKNINNESKLYHSDFYNDKVVYDSFSRQIKYENFSAINDYLLPISIDFRQSNTINSKMAFKIDTTGVGTLQLDGDFDDYLLVSRNNDMVQLNSDYLNYIKTGYNYDKKQVAIQAESANRNATISGVTAGISLLGAIAAIAAAPFTGGTSAAAGLGLAAFGLGTTAVVSGVKTYDAIKDAQDTITTANNSLAQKLSQLANQSMSSSGVDDVDLMSYYSDNKLHRIQYKPQDYISEKLYRMFDLNGYASNSFGTPDIDSRYWYNYIKCDPAVDRVNNELRQDWLEDLQERYKQGVLVLHKHIFGGTNIWDWNLLWENWETWAVEGV